MGKYYIKTELDGWTNTFVAFSEDEMRKAFAAAIEKDQKLADFKREQTDLLLDLLSFLVEGKINKFKINDLEVQVM